MTASLYLLRPTSQAGWYTVMLCYPRQQHHVASARDFVLALASGGKDFNFIKTTTDDCYGENTL